MLIGTNILIYSDLMARVTIEDCLKRIDNAYDIVSLASQRAKDILDGSEPKLDYDGKPSVIALKEIAEGLIDMSYFCLLYTSPSPRDLSTSRMPSSA